MSVYCKLCEIEMADTYCMECEGIGYGSLCSECDGDLHSIGSKTTHVRIPHEMKSMAVEAVAEVVASDDNPYVADSEVQREGNDDDEKTDPVCGICEEEKAVFACGECKSAAGIEHFCRECDSQVGNMRCLAMILYRMVHDVYSNYVTCYLCCDLWKCAG